MCPPRKKGGSRKAPLAGKARSTAKRFSKKGVPIKQRVPKPKRIVSPNKRKGPLLGEWGRSSMKSKSSTGIRASANVDDGSLQHAEQNLAGTVITKNSPSINAPAAHRKRPRKRLPPTPIIPGKAIMEACPVVVSSDEGEGSEREEERTHHHWKDEDYLESIEEAETKATGGNDDGIRWSMPEVSPLSLEAHGGRAALEPFMPPPPSLPDGISYAPFCYHDIYLTSDNVKNPLVLPAGGGPANIRVWSSGGPGMRKFVAARVLRVTPDHPDPATRALHKCLKESQALPNLVDAFRVAEGTRQLVPDESGGGSYATFAERMTMPTGLNRGRGGSLRHGLASVLEPTIRASTPALTNVAPEITAVTAHMSRVLQARAPIVLKEQAKVLSSNATLPFSAEIQTALGVGIDEVMEDEGKKEDDDDDDDDDAPPLTLRPDGLFLRLQGTGDPKIPHRWSQKVRGHRDKSDARCQMAQLMASTARGRVPGSSLTIRGGFSEMSPGVTVEMTSDDEQVFTIVVYCSSKQWHGCTEETIKGTPGTVAQSVRFIYFATAAKERFTRIERGMIGRACSKDYQNRGKWCHRGSEGRRKKLLRRTLRDLTGKSYPLPPESVEFGLGRGGMSFEITRATAELCHNYAAVHHEGGICAARVVHYVTKTGPRVKTVRLVKSGKELTFDCEEGAANPIPLSLVACTAQHLVDSYRSLYKKDQEEWFCFRSVLEKIGKLKWLNLKY
mmetsp:Transcript_54125/g.162028  ORF Transcript_54125/g.162028 Transcript_54125/m.162028 type:complete len:729 (-) Transcript_54125:31-2217(-)